MAFEIVRSNISLPGVSGGALGGTNVSVGSQRLSDAMGRAGYEISGAAVNLNRLEADNQFKEAKRRLLEDWENLEIEMKKNPNSDEYPDMFKAMMSQAKSYVPKNGLAARAYDTFYKDLESRGCTAVHEARIARAQDRSRAEDAAMLTEGRFEAYEQSVRKNLMGKYSAEQQQMLLGKVLDSARTNYQYEQGRRLALNQPDQMLSWIDEEGHMETLNMLGYDRLDSGHAMAFRNIALGSIRDRQYQQAQIQQQADLQLWDMIEKGATRQDLWSMVGQWEDLTLQQRKQLLSTAQNLYDWKTEGQDTLRFRQDNKTYWDLYQKAVDGKANEKELRQAVNDGKISVNDYKEITNIIEYETGGYRSRASEINYVMTQMDGMFDDYAIEFLGDKQELRLAKMKARNRLEGIIREQQETKPLTGSELIEEMVRVQRQVQNELELIAAVPIPEAPDVVTRAAPKVKPQRPVTFQTTIPTLTTRKEVEDLKTGAQFYMNGKLYTKK